VFNHELVSIADEFDMDDEGGRYFIANDFGYGDREYVCPDCKKKIIEDIHRQRQDAYYENLQ
jgi:hypothetical protein